DEPLKRMNCVVYPPPSANADLECIVNASKPSHPGTKQSLLSASIAKNSSKWMYRRVACTALGLSIKREATIGHASPRFALSKLTRTVLHTGAKGLIAAKNSSARSLILQY